MADSPNPASRPTTNASRAGLHPRNRHQGRYDFGLLARQCPDLSSFLITTPAGDTSVDFRNADAVRALNRALLKVDYGVEHWDIPDGYLCPPIPGRADYLHGLADLLAGCNDGVVPRGRGIRVLDIGVGANCIYPLLGQCDYGWRFVGSDVDVNALRAAEAIVQANPGLSDAIELRHQPERGSIFAGLLGSDERFDLSLCNPPFHASAEEATRGSQRKWRNLGKGDATRAALPLNFGGQASELWCTGGEASFVRRMIRESIGIKTQGFWFSSLISKAENLAAVRKHLKKAGVQELREVTMAQGSKQSRFVAWTFLDEPQRKAWRRERWGEASRN
ncbi:MAG: 23S rRNA (adenine(1618)-N(6))-methyltransferase RlmF [Lysobacter sp.]